MVQLISSCVVSFNSTSRSEVVSAGLSCLSNIAGAEGRGTMTWSKPLGEYESARENERLVRDFGRAPKDAVNAWGKGGSQGTKLLTKWDKWFEVDLTQRVLDLHYEGKLAPRTRQAVLIACAQILALRIPHWDHKDSIDSIQGALNPQEMVYIGEAEEGEEFL